MMHISHQYLYSETAEDSNRSATLFALAVEINQNFIPPKFTHYMVIHASHSQKFKQEGAFVQD